jgi:hypothetical protein
MMRGGRSFGGGLGGRWWRVFNANDTIKTRKAVRGGHYRATPRNGLAWRLNQTLMGSGRIIHLPRNVRQRPGSKQLLIGNVFGNTPAK